MRVRVTGERVRVTGVRRYQAPPRRATAGGTLPIAPPAASLPTRYPTGLRSKPMYCAASSGSANSTIRSSSATIRP